MPIKLPDKIDYKRVGIVGGTAVAAAVAGAVLVPPLVLAVTGFGSAGVAAGSVAAAIQTPVTVAGGWFAACQSAGVLGAAVTTKAVSGAVTGTIGGAIARKFASKR